MKVTNMTSPNGNKIPNQFYLSEEGYGANGNFKLHEIFQSYDSIIVERYIWKDGRIDTKLDAMYWDYSKTTAKYRNQFLNETTAETKAKIKSGEYTLTNLN